MASHLINQYFNNQINTINLSSLNQKTRDQIKNDEFINNNFICAKYKIDSVWYRAKFIREINSSQVKKLT